MTPTRIVIALSVLAALLGLAWGPVLGLPADAPAVPAAPAPSSAPAAPSWSEGLPPCAYEDGSGGPLPCYWDAGSAGNGRGCSYIIRADDNTDYGAARSVNDPRCQTAAGRRALREVMGA